MSLRSDLIRINLSTASRNQAIVALCQSPHPRGGNVAHWSSFRPAVRGRCVHAPPLGNAPSRAVQVPAVGAGAVFTSSSRRSAGNLESGLGECSIANRTNIQQRWGPIVLKVCPRCGQRDETALLHLLFVVTACQDTARRPSSVGILANRWPGSL